MLNLAYLIGYKTSGIILKLFDCLFTKRMFLGCYICLDEYDGKLVSPCKCKGKIIFFFLSLKTFKYNFNNKKS